MKKKIVSIVLSLITLMSICSPVMAQEDSIFTFEGDSGKFITEEGDNNGFEGMMPGEQRNVSIILKNDDRSSMDFFMNAEILDNIADKGNQDAVYDFKISRDGEEFFSTVIGADGNTIGEEYLTEDNNIKLATLAKGEESRIIISLTLDGDSAENSYMNQDGKIKLQFSVGTPVENTGTTQTVIDRIIQYVKTGDNTPLILMGGLLMVSLIGILYFKKKEGN